MNKKILFIFLLLLNVVCFTQTVEFGVGFTPYDVSSSKQEIKFDKDDTVEKIVNYFFNQKIFQENYSITFSSNPDVEISTSVVTIEQLTIEQLKKLFYGFGRTEIIQILLIKQKCQEVPIKSLVEERKKNKSLKEIATKYKIDYINDVWLPSKKIYKEIFLKQ
jgi:hypothetical protein